MRFLYEFRYIDITVNLDIITYIFSHFSADVVSMKEEVKHYLAEGVLSSLTEGAGVRGLQAMHGLGQRMEAMAKTAVTAEINYLWRT